jgi:hypothetical protein
VRLEAAARQPGPSHEIRYADPGQPLPANYRRRLAQHFAGLESPAFADKAALQLVRTYEIICAIVASLCSFACPGRATRRNPAPSDASVLQDRRCLVKQNLMSESIFDLGWSATDGTAAYRCFAPLYESFD